ncbi:MAG: signal peptidase I [Planctomycetota bacterium]|nr:signal peptidase I [Planctomycetota bacterium]
MLGFLKSFWFYIVGLILLWVFVYIQRNYAFVRVPEGIISMAPALESNKFYRFRQLKNPQELMYGDIVFVRFNRPSKREEYFSRVVGLEGDVVAISEGALIRNGLRVDEPYLSGPASPSAQSEWKKVVMAPLIVPKGCVFLLNDERSSWEDSRKFGSLDARMVCAYMRK